jgi:TRAP-type uncharacterized transport system fused permease subunit
MLAIAAVMIFVGFFSLVSPSDFFVAHRPVRGKAAPNVTVLEHVTVSHSRVYGLCAIIAGAAIVTFVLWGSTADRTNSR